MSEKNIFTTQHKEYYDRHSITIGMFVKIQIPQNYPSLLRRFAPCFFKRREARRRRRDTISVKGPSNYLVCKGKVSMSFYNHILYTIILL